MEGTIDDLAAVILKPSEDSSTKRGFLEALREALSDDPKLLEDMAVNRVAKLVDLLTKISDQSNERAYRVRLAAIGTLSKLVKARPEVVDSAMVGFLTKVAELDPHTYVRTGARNTLDNISETRAELSRSESPAHPSNSPRMRLQPTGRSP